LKTPALAEALYPIRRLEASAKREHEEKVKAWTFGKIVRDAKEKDIRKKIEGAIRSDESVSEFRNSSLKSKKTNPSRDAYISNDTTVEKLGELLNENPRGLLLFRDELTGWLRSLERDGHEADRAFYLESSEGKAASLMTALEEARFILKIRRFRFWVEFNPDLSVSTSGPVSWAVLGMTACSSAFS